MGDFWKSAKRKARKTHKCLYCRKVIEKGEEYFRETGTFEGDFQDYCLCPRCLYVIEKYEEPGEYLTSLADVVIDNRLYVCPSCGSSNYRDYEFSKDVMSIEFECDNCDEKWTADLSMEGLMEAGSLV